MKYLCPLPALSEQSINILYADLRYSRVNVVTECTDMPRRLSE